MRLSHLFLVSLLFTPCSQAAQVKNWNCQSQGPEARCQIELEGEVSEGDRLYLSRVHDRDQLSFQGLLIGSTGAFLGREFHAGFFPRVYPLNALKGLKDPVLTLEAHGGLMHNPGIPGSARVKVIDSQYPMWKLLGPPVLQFLSFAFLVNLCFYLLLWLKQRNTDGWIYPKEELRWFLGSLGAYLLLRHEVAELFVPLLWSAEGHLFAQRLAVSVFLWSLSLLLLQGRFSDRSCIERTRPRSSSRNLARLAHVSLFVSLGALGTYPNMSENAAALLLAVPAVSLLLALVKTVREMEWRRVFKRSSKSPLLFQCSLMILPVSAALVSVLAWRSGGGSQKILEFTSWVVILLSGLRMRGHLQAKEKSRELAAYCRELLMEHSIAEFRLQVLCNFVADEWGAARISVISVDDENGLVLASAGPEAIPSANRTEARRLGPFLRRVCKQGQMLYAPVAEELGQDLQSQGLKHSSLAIPLTQEKEVRAVLCMMADEGERIPPGDASQLELLVETLSLEILSAVSQHVAENRNKHLLHIARMADALAVENLDHWGHYQSSKGAETRVVLGGDCIPAGPFFEQLKKSPVLGKIWASYRAEIRALWTAVATSFEFIPKDNRDDFWVISPKNFRNPLLQELGAERAALLLAVSLERHARSLANKECYSALGYCGVRLVSSEVGLRQSTWHGSAVEIDSDQFSRLLDLRQKALPGSILFHGNAPSLSSSGARNAFLCRTRPWDDSSESQIYSILAASADKKELRKLENQALEKVRALSKKAA